jgi:hypothetical protein
MCAELSNSSVALSIHQLSGGVSPNKGGSTGPVGSDSGVGTRGVYSRPRNNILQDSVAGNARDTMRNLPNVINQIDVSK